MSITVELLNVTVLCMQSESSRIQIFIPTKRFALCKMQVTNEEELHPEDSTLTLLLIYGTSSSLRLYGVKNER